MKEGRASYTAELIAIDRAVESMKPAHRRVCDDPLAVHFLSTRYRVIAKSHLLARFVYWYRRERPVPGAVGEAVARTRLIDDYLKSCIDDGIQQLVILGAGYDSRAYRIDGLKGKVGVFEVDHPATQRVKTHRLRKIFGFLPDHVVYVPIDFDKEELDKRLFESGYDGNLKTLFIWEGVTMYISAEAVDETLSFVASNSGEGSSIIFNYTFQSVIDGTYDLGAWEREFHLEVLAKLGEPWIFGIEEGTIDEFLSKRGFCQINNATADLMKNTYFTGPNQGRKILPCIPTVCATVKPRG
jgi:methyltransferase (TIGR00027 family)